MSIKGLVWELKFYEIKIILIIRKKSKGSCYYLI